MTVLFTDNFNRANAADPGANYTTLGTSSGPIPLVGNQVVNGAAAFNLYGSFYSAGAVPDDQYAQATMTANSGFVGTGMGIAVRCAGSNAYGLFVPATATELYRVESGGYTLLAISTDVAAVPDVIYVEAVANQITVKINGVVDGTAIDGVLTSGAPGLIAVAPDGALDNFEIGHFLTAAALGGGMRRLFGTIRKTR